MVGCDIYNSLVPIVFCKMLGGPNFSLRNFALSSFPLHNFPLHNFSYFLFTSSFLTLISPGAAVSIRFHINGRRGVCAVG